MTPDENPTPPDDDIPPLAPLDETPRVVDDRVASARKVVDLFGTQWPSIDNEAPLPFVKPSFNLREMFVGVTAVAVYLGLIRWLGPYAVVALQAAYALCCWFWKRGERTAFQHLAFDVTGGIVLPLSVLSLAQVALAESPMVLVLAHMILLCMLLMVVWIGFGTFLGPRSFAFISGALMTGGTVALVAGMLCTVFAAFIALIMLVFGELSAVAVVPLLTVPLSAGVVYLIHSAETYALAGDSVTTNIMRGFGILVTFLALPVLFMWHAELADWWSGILSERAEWWRF